MGVELNLTKLLIPQFSIEGQMQTIEYECMNLLCLHCGRYGHVKEACGELKKMQKDREKVTEENGGKEGRDAKKEVQRVESPWKVVQRPWRQRRVRYSTDNQRVGNRFAALGEVKSELGRRRPLTEMTNRGNDEKVGVVSKGNDVKAEMMRRGIVEKRKDSDGEFVGNRRARASQQGNKGRGDGRKKVFKPNTALVGESSVPNNRRETKYKEEVVGGSSMAIDGIEDVEEGELIFSDEGDEREQGELRRWGDRC